MIRIFGALSLIFVMASGCAAPDNHLAPSVATPGSDVAKAAPTGPFYNVRDYGAVGNGEAKDTRAIQQAIDAANQASNGTVYFPAGIYLSGTLYLKSGVTLHLESGATLFGSTDLNDYPVIICKYRSYTDNYTIRSLIYAENQQDIGIVGKGTIDGQGSKFRGPEYKIRPYMIRMITCRNIRLEDITLQHSPMWTQHYLACENMTIQGIKVDSRVNNNNNMIDLDSCRDVRISDCVGYADDDALTLKSTSDLPCENITITNCVLSSGVNAIKMGTESNGGFKNITISNCAITRYEAKQYFNGMVGGEAGIALEIVDGGTIDRVTISNITINGPHIPLFIRLGNRARPFKEGQKPKVGKIQNLVISDIVATASSNTGCAIAGIPDHPIKNVTLSNLNFTFPGGGNAGQAARSIPEVIDKYPGARMFGTLPAYGFYCRHVEGLKLSNINVRWRRPDARPALFCDDVKDLEVDGLTGPLRPNGYPLIVLQNVNGAAINGCVTPVNTNGLLRIQGHTENISVMGNDLSQAQSHFEFGPRTTLPVIHQSANRFNN